jgi:sulfatase maturation enzyme AslB (radical SAM superfamily)
MITDKLQAHLRVRPEVIVASEEDVKSQVYAGNSRKLIRFVDKRKNYEKLSESYLWCEFSQEEIAEPSRGRLLSMELEFNKSCNLRCLYCYASDHTVQRDELSREEFFDLITQAKELGARKMIVLGGEPMLYPHIMEMIRFIRGLDMDVELFTNGTNITREKAQELYEAGVRVVLKMNTFDEKVRDTLSGRRRLYQIHEAFNNLRQAGYPSRTGSWASARSCASRTSKSSQRCGSGCGTRTSPPISR